MFVGANDEELYSISSGETIKDRMRIKFGIEVYERVRNSAMLLHELDSLLFTLLVAEKNLSSGGAFNKIFL
jgi:hypothetical protein